MEFQQARGFLRPQPSPTADPYQRPPTLMPPPPGNQQWPYPPAQFQFQPQAQNSPSPPPPQWPPPPPQPRPPYPGYPPMPYPAHHPHPSQPYYPQPNPFPPRPPQAPHSYAQDWRTASGSHQQYTTDNNEEDWAAKARAWAAAKAATENQLPPSHSVSTGRNEDQNNFHGHFSQPLDSQFHEMHRPLGSTLNYQQYPVATGPPTWPAQGQLLDSQISISGESAYASDPHETFSSNGAIARDSVSQTPQTKASISPFVHPQEVPSSYSSLAGADAAQERIEKIDGSSSLPVASHSQLSANGRLGWMEEIPQVLGGPPDSVPDLSNKPLNFSPYFNHGREPIRIPSHSHASGGHVSVADPTLAMTSNFAWTPSSAPGPVYAPVPPPITSGPQRDPTVMPPPASGHTAPIFSSGPGFQPTVHMIGAAFGVSSALVPHPTSFSGDAYGVSERPKKASVPNWLREEIIKNRTALASSVPDIHKDDSESIEEDSNDAYFSKRNQADSKSIDSARSTEEDEDDEDEMEAARSAAINQEIKRILTEVLLKVTDELFDEIATKVLREDDVSSQDRQDIDSSKHQNLESTPNLTAKASTKVLLPVKVKDGDYEDVHEKSNSGSPGDLLGLASYASDEEEDKTQSANRLNQLALSSGKLLESSHNIENGGLSEAKDKGTDLVAFSADCVKTELNSGSTRLKDDEIDDLAPGYPPSSSGRLSDVGKYESENASDIPKLNNSSIEKSVERSEVPSDASLLKVNSKGYDESDGRETKKHLSKKEGNDSESSKKVMDGNDDEECARHGKRRERNGRVNHDDNSEEKGRTGDVVRKSGLKRQASPYRGKEGRADVRNEKKISLRDDEDEKQLAKAMDERKEQGRHKSGMESSQHWRQKSSLAGARRRESKDNVSHSNNSSDESLGYSKRKSHHSRRNKSPSPARSKKRQVSPSAHSRHSKRRHSPYSSLETSRRRKSPSRSRSKSPARRR